MGLSHRSGSTHHATLATVARSIHVRLDDTAEAALSVLRNTGMSDSEAVRIALRESAASRRTKAALRAEAARLVADPVNLAEMKAVREFMEELAPRSEPGR
jgi:antitoxin component of RelBE/YafQ-DinJ toxin-antitoxin module